MTTRIALVSRSVAVIAATGALIAGVTFAAIGDTSTVSLTGNTLSASAALQIAPDASGSAGTFVLTTGGFTSTTAGMRFGVERKAGDFWLKNTATGDQSVTVAIPTAPIFTNVTAAHVHVRFAKGATTEATGTLANLVSPGTGLTFTDHESPSAGGTKYSVFYTVDAPASGVSASVGTFDLNFTGTEL